jgi:site-specific DNA-cytosine methylase
MSFRDSFKFPEDQAMTSVARQIGNAVPPLLARRIAEALVVHLDAVLGQLDEGERSDQAVAAAA